MDIMIKIDSINEQQLLNHFIQCSTAIDGVNFVDHSHKLRQNACTIEAWKDDDLVGLCACYMNNLETRIAYITHIEVHPECKHKGYGRKIMDATIVEAKSKGFEKIQLEVHKDNEVAIAFYGSFGFKNIEDRGNKYLMEKSI